MRTMSRFRCSKDVIGDQAQVAAGRHEGHPLRSSTRRPVGIQLPPRVTLEIIDTEPATKGQTASSSYKPAKMSNGARVMVPPHVTARNQNCHPDGRRIVPTSNAPRTDASIVRYTTGKDSVMQLAMIGLGRMGANIVRRRIQLAGHQCVVYDRDPKHRAKRWRKKARLRRDLARSISYRSSKTPRAIWVMLPAGRGYGDRRSTRWFGAGLKAGRHHHRRWQHELEVTTCAGAKRSPGEGA